MAGFRKIALSGFMFSATAQFVKILIQILSVSVLSRLLLPQDFGLIATLSPVITLITLLQDLGLQQAIVQARRIDDAEVNRIFWINIGIGGLLSSLLIAGGSMIAVFFNEPKLSTLASWWAIPLLLGAISSQHTALLSRSLRFRTIATIDVCASVAGLAAAFSVAFIFQSYWALYIQVLATSGVTMIGCWAMSGWNPSSPFRKANALHLLSFGANFAGFNILNFLSRNLDNIIIAKTYGSAAVGNYDRAYKLLLSPIQTLNAPLGRVLLPILGRMLDDPKRYRKLYNLVVFFIVTASAPSIIAFIANSDDFIYLLLGPRWTQVADTFFWLGLAAMTQPLSNTTGWLFLTQHRTNDMLKWGIFSCITTVASFLIGLPYGVEGVAASYAIVGIIVRQPALFLYVGRSGPVNSKDLFNLQTPALFAGIIFFLLHREFIEFIDLDRVVRILVSLVFSYFIYFCVVFVFPGSRQMARVALSEHRRFGNRGDSGSP
jgi:PST family polysaccharide transporter